MKALFFSVVVPPNPELLTEKPGGIALSTFGTSRTNYLTVSICLYVCFGATAPPVGQGLLIHEVSRSHTLLTTVGDSSGRVIISTQGTST